MMDVVSWISFGFAGIIILISETRVYLAKKSEKEAIEDLEELLDEYLDTTDILDDMLDAVERSVDEDAMTRINDAFIVNTFRRSGEKENNIKGE